MNEPAILVTGFEPFGGADVNPSWQVARALDGARIGADRAVVRALRLRCVFGSAAAEFDTALRRWRPRLVLALGQAAGRSDFSVERVAINVDDARIADNAGACPIDEPVVAGAPAAYFSTLPVKAIVAALRAAGLPASVSQTAGTYVCNHAFYVLMHALRDERATRGGFVHLPLLPAQAAATPAAGGAGSLPSLPLETMVRGVRIVLEAALAQATDLRAAGGAEH